jgi:hypothetical protein
MPTVADVETIAKTLGSILAGKPQSHGALTVIPTLAPMPAEPEWLTVAEAGDRVCITEISEGGSVPNLRVANLGDLPLLLLDGEQLVGAKQNRILNMTVLVAAHTEVTIPVSCVEQGRWGYRARHSAPSDVSLYAGVSRSLREGRGHTADQQGVWKALAQQALGDGRGRLAHRQGMPSPRRRALSQGRRRTPAPRPARAPARRHGRDRPAHRDGRIHGGGAALP